MSTLTIHLFGVAGITALAFLVFQLVRTPLAAVLAEICGAEHRAGFWTRLYAVLLVVAVALSGLVDLPDAGTGAAPVLVDVLRAGLFGLLAFLVALAAVMIASIRSYDRQAQSRPRRAEWPTSTDPADSTP